MAYGPQIPGLDKSGGGVNLAAPGAIGGTTAGSGAFTTLTASGTLAVTGATTLTGELTLGGVSSVLFRTSNTMPDQQGYTSVSLTSNGPSGVYSTPVKWIAYEDGGYTYYLPAWGLPP
jgi:hypothetical protein